MTAVPTVVRKRIDSLPMKVGAGDFPVPPIRFRPHQEGALRGAQEQEHVPVLDIQVPDTAQHQGARTGRLFAPRRWALSVAELETVATNPGQYRRAGVPLQPDIARMVELYGHFYRSALLRVFHRFEAALVRWAR